jgi:Ca2+-binding EF-hand superfamily protein
VVLGSSFEKEVRARLGQKATSFVSEEQILLKSFKYFDLDNSGRVDYNEFVKAIEKLGVAIQNENVSFNGLTVG